MESFCPNPVAPVLAGKRSRKSICGSYNQSRAASAHPRPSRSPVAPFPLVQRRNRWPHPDTQTPAPPPSPGKAPASRFAGRTTSPGPPAPTRGRAGHRWRRFPRPSVATGGRILVPKPRRPRPRREKLPQVDFRVVQPVPGRQRPPEAEPVTGGAVSPGPASQPVAASWCPNPGAPALAGKRSRKSISGSYNQSRTVSAHPRRAGHRWRRFP
jgi:hypothetical protein